MEPFDQYKKIQIKTASQEQLILMLYDGAIRFINLALEALSENIYDKTNNYIIRSQNIITELMLSLKLDVGDVAKNLYSIYNYMNRRLIEGNVQKKPAPLEEVLKLLTDLRDIWNEVFKKKNEVHDPESSEKEPPAAGGFNVQG